MAVEVPPGVITRTSTGPACPAGATAVADVADATFTDVAATDPKRTDVAPVRFVPVMVTTVPPAAVPVAGATRVTAGLATPVMLRTPDRKAAAVVVGGT